MKKILFIFGTRPEAIKLAPLIYACRKAHFDVRVCVTAQHRQMLDQVLGLFNIAPDYDLNMMENGQSLSDIGSKCLKSLGRVIDKVNPDMVFVQGDTTTTFAGALSAYYKKVPVAHIEAGLRSGNKFSPFPEEINRVLTSHIADYHFPPTQKAAENLKREGVVSNVWVVGNTIVDALFMGLDIIRKRGELEYEKSFRFVNFNRKILLVTGHRRESFGSSFESICYGLLGIVNKHDGVEIVYPVHLNPNVREPVHKILGNNPRIHLIEPVDYPRFIWLMGKSYFILTDSGGVQEEAPSLRKPVLVMRDVTERAEGVRSGVAKLVGTESKNIINEATSLLEDKRKYRKMSKVKSPYGDGKTSERIVGILSKVMKHG